MLEKIKSLIEDSKSFAILLGQNPEEHEILLKEILLTAINNKNLPAIALPSEHDIGKTKWASVFRQKKNVPFHQKTSIKLPKGKYSIKEVAYAEDNDHLSLIITSPDRNLLKEDLIFENLPPQIDGVFCFFEESSKLNPCADRIQLPGREKIVFITQNDRTLTEKIFDIAKIIDPAIMENNGIPTLFFAALIKETNNFSEKISEETLSLGSLLLKKGAEKNLVSSIIEKENNSFTAQLLGRAMARTYVDELLNVSWSFLNQKDFQKTNSSPSSPLFLYNILRKTRALIPPQKLNLLIWQSPEGIKAIAASLEENRKYLLPLANRLGAGLKSRFFVAGPFENFSKAELTLRQAIKEVLYPSPNC